MMRHTSPTVPDCRRNDGGSQMDAKLKVVQRSGGRAACCRIASGKLALSGGPTTATFGRSVRSSAATTVSFYWMTTLYLCVIAI